MTVRPPVVGRALLRLYPLGTRRAEIEADLLELLESRAAAHGPRYARRRYYRDVLSLWRTPPTMTPTTTTPPHPRARLQPLVDIFQDLTYAVRLFRRSPGTVGVTVVGLALAIAVSTAVFTMVNATLFRPSGIADPATAVRVFRTHERGYSTSWPHSEFAQLRGAASGISLEAWLPERHPLISADGTAPMPPAMVMFVSGGFLDALAGRAALGRLLNAADDGPNAAPALVVSHGFWKRQLASDPAIVGRRVPWNGIEFTIVGVTPRAFRGPEGSTPDFWAPLGAYHVALGGAPLAASATTGVAVVGRTHQRSARAAVEGSLSGIARGFAAADGREAHPGVRLESIGSGPTNSADRRVFALVLASVFTVIGLVLIVGCINVANLLLASAVARRAEVGLRLALGASRARLARQLLTESLSLGLLSGAIALVLTMWLVPILARLAGAPSSIDTTPDLRVYAFLFVVSLAAGLGAGFAPARHAAGDALASPLKGSGASGREAQPSSRLRPALVGVQAATSLVLVVLAALLTRGMIRATQVDVGFDAARLLTVVPSFPRGAYDVAGAQAYWNIVLERVRALPGVQAAALTSHPPFGSGNRVTIFNRGGNRYTILHHDANAEYFTTLGLRTVRGRTFTADEVRAQAPVAVITESMAREFFPAADPIGQPLDRIGVEADPAVVIVGVVSDAITARLRELGAASIYRPMTDTRDARLMIRADSPAALVAPVRSALHAIDPRVRLDIAPISDSLRRQLDEPRTLASMAATLALLALLLAVVGIYGVTAFVVGQRTHELGVRVALGATTTDVRRLLVLDSLRPIGYGLAGGVVASLLAGRVLRGTLYGIGAADPIAFGAAIALLLIVALGAVLLPTRRAAAVDPSSLLRQL